MGGEILRARDTILRLRHGGLLLLTALLCWAAPAPVDAAFNKEKANSCYDCHIASTDKRLNEPAMQWSSSVHAEVGNTCDGCHGGNPGDPTKAAMSPQNNFHGKPKEEEVVDFCGKCHKELADNFKTSMHGMMGKPVCTTCHGAHTIHRISLEIINPNTCTECHTYEKPELLRAILEKLHRQFKTAKDKVTLIHGFPTDAINKDLDRDWKKLREVRMISHTADLTKIQTYAAGAEAAIKQTDGEIEKLVTLSRDRNLWGYTLIGVFLVLAFATWRYNKHNDEE